MTCAIHLVFDFGAVEATDIDHTMSHLEQQDQSASREWEGEGHQEDHPITDNSAHEEDEEFECSESGSNFQTKNELVEHALRQCDIGHFVCQECGEQFADESDLTRHTLTHRDVNTNGKFSECRKCGKILSWESDITKHIQIHTGDVNFNPNDMDEEQSRENQENILRGVENASPGQMDMEASEIGSSMDGHETSASGEWQAEANQMNHPSQESHFECSDCGKAFSMKSNLARYGPNHLGIMTFRCEECESRESHPPQHDEYNVGDYECQECGKRFIQKSNLTTHMLIHSGVRNYGCQECGKKFLQKSHLLDHISTHIDEKNYECKLCTETFSLKSSLDKHFHSHTELKRFECAHCEKKFARKSYLKVHIKKCAIAKKEMSASHPDSDEGAVEAADASHESVISVKKEEEDQKDYPDTDTAAQEEEMHQCPGCGSTFQTKSELVEHTLRQCDIGNFECHVCSKKFTHKSNLTRHMQIHTGIKNHECPECGKKFFQKGNLKQHMLTHRGDCNYECKKCGKNFFLLSSLVRHSHVHNMTNDECQESEMNLTLDDTQVASSDIEEEESSQLARTDAAIECVDLDSSVSSSDMQKMSDSAVGDKENHLVTDTSVEEEEVNFKCSECGEPFQTKSKLAAHTLRHSSVRTFECEVCGKVFTYKSNLTRHLLIHSGIKNYECERCGKRFSQKGNLLQHMVIHRGDKNYVCQRCGEKFYLKCSLSQHVCTQASVGGDGYQQSGKLHAHSSLPQHDNFGVNLGSQGKNITNSNVAAYIIVDAVRLGSSGGSMELQEQSASNVSQSLGEQLNHLAAGSTAYKEDKRYECAQCGKRFTFRSNLTRHSMIHSGVRNHECLQCGKKFNQKGNLNQHMLTHRGEKNYVCPGCGEKFHLKCALSKHVCSFTSA